MNKLWWSFFFFVAALVPSALASGQPLLEKMKSFKCKPVTSEGELMDQAHALLRNSMVVLSKGIAKNEDLLRETLKIVFCTEKYDNDSEGVELIEPLVDDQEKEFDKVLKSFSKDQQEKLNEDLDRIAFIRKNGSG